MKTRAKGTVLETGFTLAGEKLLSDVQRGKITDELKIDPKAWEEDSDEKCHGPVFRKRHKQKVIEADPWIIFVDDVVDSGRDATVYETKHDVDEDLPLPLVTKIGEISLNEVKIAVLLGAAGIAPKVYDAWWCPRYEGEEGANDASETEDEEEDEEKFIGSGSGFLVMEKVVGQTLHELVIKKKDLSALSGALLRRIEATVNAMQQLGVKHDDLHMDNIMISDKGHVKLIDFGRARFIGKKTRKKKGKIFEELYDVHEEEEQTIKQRAKQKESMNIILRKLNVRAKVKN